MKLRFKIGILFIIVLAAWLLFNITPKDKSTINKASMQSVSSVIQNQPSSNKKTIAAKTSNNDELEVVQINKPLFVADIKQLSYLELYERSLDLKNCYGYIQTMDQNEYELKDRPSVNKEIDFIEEYKQKIPRISNNRQQDATDKQISAYQKHIESCKSTIAQIEDLYDEEEEKIKSSYYPTTKIRLLLKETKVESKEEKQLKSTLEQVESLDEIFGELNVLSKGETQLGEKELRDLTNDIDRLNWEVLRIKQNSAGLQDSQELQEIEAEFEQKKTYLASLYTYDTQTQIAKGKELLSVIEKLNQKLNSKYHRVFTEAFKGLNFHGGDINKLPKIHTKQQFEKIGANFPIISEQILEHVSISNKVYFNQLLQPALDLYQCYLGQDCTFPINRKLAKLCFMPPWIYYEACEMNLEEFYLENYFTENQVEDLNIVFSYLVQTYAK